MAFAIYVEVQVRTTGIGSSIAKGFAAAAAGMAGGGNKVLAGLGAALSSRLSASAAISAESIANRMLADVQEILSRPGRGRTYTTQWRTNRKTGQPFPVKDLPLGKAHVASAPGDPPAMLSGDLYQSIEYEVTQTVTGPVILIGTQLDYGLYLEFGMSRYYLPRPWMRVLANSLKAGRMITRGDGYTVILSQAMKQSAAGFLSGLFRGGS